MFLTLLFAFYKFGYHNILQMSRESAWRIHYTLGICTLVIGFAHTVVVFQQLGVSVVFASMTSVFGLVSLGLMFMGVIPAKFVIYDHFKVLHFLILSQVLALAKPSFFKAAFFPTFFWMLVSVKLQNLLERTGAQQFLPASGASLDSSSQFTTWLMRRFGTRVYWAFS